MPELRPDRLPAPRPSPRPPLFLALALFLLAILICTRDTLMLLLSLVLQAADQAPPGIAPWLWGVLGAVGSFLAMQVWPAARGWLDAEYKERREAARKGASTREERFLKAQEQTAQALVSIAESNRETAQALKIFAEHRVAENFVSQGIQRQLEAIRERLDLDPPEPRRRRRPTESEVGS